MCALLHPPHEERLERRQLRVAAAPPALELERVPGLRERQALDHEGLASRFDDDLEVAPAREPQRLEEPLLPPVGAEAVAHAEEELALDLVAVALRELPFVRLEPQRLGELQADDTALPSRADHLGVDAGVVPEVRDDAAARVRRNLDGRAAIQQALPVGRLAREVVGRAHGDGQRVERRHLRHVANPGRRPGAIDHRRQRSGLQVPRGRDAVREERARGPLVRHHGRPALARAALEAPGTGLAVEGHRRAQTPDVDGRLEGVAGQELALPGGDARVEPLRLGPLGGEQERRTHLELRERRVATEREDARHDHVRPGAERDVDGVVEPVLGRAALGTASDPAAVEEELVALVCAHPQAHVAGPGPIEPEPVGGDERRLACIRAADPGSLPRAATVPGRLLEQRREGGLRLTDRRGRRRRVVSRSREGRGSQRTPEHGGRRLQHLPPTNEPSSVRPRANVLSLPHRAGILCGSGAVRPDVVPGLVASVD